MEINNLIKKFIKNILNYLLFFMKVNKFYKINFIEGK